jgi:S1-C subfamily serine protease
MSLVDVGIVLFVIALGAVGYERGLLASVLPLAGFIGGAALGARVGPELLSQGAQSQYAPLVATITGLLVGAFAAVALDGVTRRLGTRRPGSVARRLDGIGGALILGALALLVCWGFGAVALHATGVRDLREAVQRSTLLGALNDVLPPSGPLLHVLRRVDPTTSVRGPNADVAPPDPSSVDDPAVRNSGGSTVRVLGTACGLGVEGSGWVAAPGLVVTNAHVVAGEDDTTVNLQDGTQFDAIAVHYDPRNDLALLAVEGLDLPPLALGDGRRGDYAAVIGYPGNGPLAFTPARLGRTGTVTSDDSYGRGPVVRRMTPFRADVRSGNSGGPVVNLDGDVVTTVFAASAGGSDEVSGLGVPNSVVRRALDGRLKETGTGPCAI